MARALLRQPDGLLCVWSTIVDDFILYDATPEDYVEFVVADAVKEARRRAQESLAEVAERGTDSRMGRTFESALSARLNQHGKPSPEKDGENYDAAYAIWLALHTPEGWQPDPDED